MEDTIEVVPSEETVTPVETPSEQPKEQVPAIVEPVTPAETPTDLFETPDGRKVDAVTLQKEWKENFLPEFTRKSQELAQLKNGNSPTNQTVEKPYEKPDWQPQTYDELLKVAEEKVLTTLQQREQARIDKDQARETEAMNQLAEVKKADPTVNENALYLHATKYRFGDLRLAHQNMKDMSELAKKVQTTTAQNIAKRNDPVSVQPGATGAKPDPSQFNSARDYLRSLK